VHTGFRLVPTSVTLNDLERHNNPYFAFFLPNSIVLQADYVTVVDDRPKIVAEYCLPLLIKTLTLPRGLSVIAKLLFIIALTEMNVIRLL